MTILKAGISITPGAMVPDNDFLQEVEISEHLKLMAAGGSWRQAYAQAQAPGARPGPGPGTGRRVRGPGPGTGRACWETGRAGEIPPKAVALRGYLKRYGKKIYWVHDFFSTATFPPYFFPQFSLIFNANFIAISVRLSSKNARVLQ